MASKRTRVKATAAAANCEAVPPHLAGEVYDLLLEAGRKELETMLAIFVKASSKAALETVRSEAIKRGVFVALKPSRYQQCNHAMLDSFFSFLAPPNLRVVDVVCRRWRSACVYSSAGWTSSLSRWQPERTRLGMLPTFGKDWLREIGQRRVSLNKLTACRRTSIDSRLNALFAAVAKLPALAELTLKQNLSAPQIQLLGGLSSLRSLEICSPRGIKEQFTHIDALIAAPFAQKLTELDVGWVGIVVGHARRLLCALPRLIKLNLWLEDFPSDEAEMEELKRADALKKPLQSGVQELEVRGMDNRSWMPPVCEFAALLRNVMFPRLTHLGLGPTMGPVTLLTAMPALSSLRLCWSGEDLTALAALPNLTDLSGVNNPADLKFVAALPKLQALGVELDDGREFSDYKDLFGPLHKLKHLQKLLVEMHAGEPGMIRALPR